MKLSIIIPTHNREQSLRKALLSLKKQSYQDDYEIVVVVDGCNDGTQEMLLRDFPKIQMVVFQKNVGAAVGLNAGAIRARGEILLFLDDDMEYNSSLIEEHLKIHSRNKYEVVIGHFPLGDLPTRSYFREVIYDWTEGWQRSFDENVSFYDALCSGHFSITREMYLHVDGFDEDFSCWGRKDSELGYRLIEAGAKFGFALSAKATQNYDKSPSCFLKDYQALGEADVQLYKKHPALRNTLLLSRYYQAPWLVQLLRGFGADEPLIVSMMLPFFARGFNFLHQQKIHSKVLEGLLWVVADLYYWKGVRKAIGGNKKLQEFTGMPVSILMYHSIGEGKTKFSVSEESFENQMKYLKDNGYQVFSLKEVLQAFKNRELLPDKSVVITFDDGYKNFFLAHDILKKYHFSATLFIPTKFIGKSRSWENDDTNTTFEMLSHQDLKELIDQGVDIQAHGHTHQVLTQLSSDVIREEILQSKKILEDLGTEIYCFAYPSGDFSNEVQRILKEEGFLAGLSCISTLASGDCNFFALPRITIENSDLEDFAIRLKYGISRKYAQEEFLLHLEQFRPTKWWHDAMAFDKNRIYHYQIKRPKKL